MEMIFIDRVQFREWLTENVENSDGIWIRLSKDKEKPSISAAEALDECLCFGWIDGKMKSEGEKSYLKYYSPRIKNSNWSEKNKKAVERLRSRNLMTEYGEREVRKAIENGQWNREKLKPDFKKMIDDFLLVLQHDPDLTEKFTNSPESRKKQFVGFYFEAKSEDTRRKRFEKISFALRENNKGMLY